jgi:putative tryptophan/tyrosine transport system substrate-binding protein
VVTADVLTEWTSLHGANSEMNRRGFIGAAMAILLANPPAGRAQQGKAHRRIGWLALGQPPTAAEIQEAWAPARRLGWIEGQNLIVERRYASGRSQLLRPFAEELVRLNVEIIATSGTDATLAAKNATASIPIVFNSAGDPVRARLVESLARPGGNVTGVAQLVQGLDAKRLSLLREVLPDARRIGDFENPNNPIWRQTRDEYEQAYSSLGLQPVFIQVATVRELDNALGELEKEKLDALIVRSDGLFEGSRVDIMQSALRNMLPAFVDGADFFQAGALLSYSTDGSEHLRFLALIDKILRGATPADLPVEQATRFDLRINLKIAKALALKIPQSLLLRADEVIQ